MGNIVPQDVGEMILLRQLWTMQSLNDLVDAIIADAQTGEAATSGSGRQSKISQQHTDDLVFGKRPKKPSSTDTEEIAEKTIEELLKLNIGRESEADESPFAPLNNAAEEQVRAHEVYLSMLVTEEDMFAEDVHRWFSSRPELAADDKGRALPLQADKHSSSAVLDAAHNAVKNVIVWSWIESQIAGIDYAVIEARDQNQHEHYDKFYQSICLQILSNVCNYEYTRTQSLLKRNLSKGSKLMKRGTNGLDPAGNYALKLRGKPQEFIKSDPQLHILLTLCQPETTAAKAVSWLKKLGDLYQKIPLEREKFSEEVVDSLGSLAIIVNFIENATKAISMPPPSRKKGQMFIIRAQELEAEINELKKDLDLSEFAVPISKLKEQGKTEGALKRPDEFVVAKAGAKMSDLYSVMLHDCNSYLYEQREDAKAKGKMDWTPLPIEAPKTREELIELRRTSAKDNAKDPTEPTKLYDIIHSNKWAAELDETGFYFSPPDSIQVDSLAFETFTKLFGNSKPRKRIVWEDLEYSLEGIGFSSRSIYGICTYFIADKDIAELPLTIKHPYKSEVSGRTSVILARRLLKAYEWNASAFKLV
ncbi:hypothetical protein CSIM01_07553 [Colletotrichum simmondsii]|uniref:Ipa protein n=1 Tax=Colletotrichum simmondsii TaxID=703756 RepID=A0A135SAH5_9PEZI|nr:hypothetical protein CSIM01_07553 [Colletotrichum simmondsii]